MEDFRDMPQMRSAAASQLRAAPVHWAHSEPALSDMLADPITQMLMRRDGVQEAEVRRLLTRLRQQRQRRRAGND